MIYPHQTRTLCQRERSPSKETQLMGLFRFWQGSQKVEQRPHRRKELHPMIIVF